MVRIFCKTILTLCCTILLLAVAQARTLKEVYLRDGGIIECQKVWQANGKVMVLVNRDTLLDLSRSEVDLKKTFAKKHAKAAKKMVQMKKPTSEPAMAKPQAAPQPTAKPVVVTAAEHKAATPMKPTAKPAPVATKPAVPAAKPTRPSPKQPAEPVKAKTPQAAKPAVQQLASQVKKQAGGAAVTTPEAPRANLPLAKPATPPETQRSLLSGNKATVGLISLLVLLVIGLLLYKKKQQE